MRPSDEKFNARVIMARYTFGGLLHTFRGPFTGFEDLLHPFEDSFTRSGDLLHPFGSPFTGFGDLLHTFDDPSPSSRGLLHSFEPSLTGAPDRVHTFEDRSTDAGSPLHTFGTAWTDQKRAPTGFAGGRERFCTDTERACPALINGNVAGKAVSQDGMKLLGAITRVQPVELICRDAQISSPH